MNEGNENPIIHEIQNEYRKIDKRWMRLQLFTFIGLVIVGFVIECAIGLVWFQTGSVEISPLRYILKYILAPLMFNLSFVLVGILVMRSSRVGQKKKAYTLSFLFVGACFVLYTVHSIFYSLFLVFTVPILLTVVYSDFTLTTITAAAGIAAKAVSELFIVWDPDKVNPQDSMLGINNFIISIFILCVFYAACMIVIRFEKEKIAARIQKEIEHYQTQQKLIIDDMTEIYNRTALRDAFKNMENDPSDNTYTFVMIDIDNFKTLNDTFGHAKGDKCLKEFAAILRKNCGEDSAPFRFGGDEFCILFNNTALENVVLTCKNIQRDLKEGAVSASTMQMTASFGIARYDKPMLIKHLLANTDSAMYRAKAAKDSICVCDGPDEFV